VARRLFLRLVRPFQIRASVWSRNKTREKADSLGPLHGISADAELGLIQDSPGWELSKMHAEMRNNLWHRNLLFARSRLTLAQSCDEGGRFENNGFSTGMAVSDLPGGQQARGFYAFGATAYVIIDDSRSPGPFSLTCCRHFNTISLGSSSSRYGL